MPVNSFEHYPMSWKPKFDKRAKPYYTYLADVLEQDIKEGIILPGTKLPPQRELADYLDLNLSTITKAFKICEMKGLISGSIGKGTYVTYDAIADTFLLPKVKDIIEMGSMIPEESAYDDIMHLVRDMVEEDNFRKWFGYVTPYEGIWQKEAAIRLIAKSGFHVQASDIMYANGGQNAISAILASLFRPGDRIGTDPFTYPGVKTVAKMLGIQLIPIACENGEMSETGIKYAIKNEGIKGLYLMPDYHNPTAHIMTDSMRKKISVIAKEENLLIIEDAINNLMKECPSIALASYAPERTIHIASLSKVIAPGLRLAYVVVPDNFKCQMEQALYNFNISVSPFMVEIAARLIASGKADEIIEKHRLEIKRRNRLVNKYFSEVECLGAETSIFRLLILPNEISEKRYVELANQRGVSVYPSEMFAVGATKPMNAVRIAIGAPKTLDELEKGLKVLHDILKESYAIQ